MDDLDYLKECWDRCEEERQKCQALVESTNPNLPANSRLQALAGTVVWQAFMDEYSTLIEHIKATTKTI